ncbi:hypothetical protein FDP41_004697 [Naegleria fowleri]|uniref:Flavin-containing monooxygenase n=2 Tax=Naegleria fowleri TaxID=5763 RepID=A0A6A5BP24_NAEFO|nr:uncharacterized protein FDP41_004697 [Naegleria fowleri]KAF0976021.1 hypothetical protein FDP41_004697 [Naegleria fowleri]
MSLWIWLLLLSLLFIALFVVFNTDYVFYWTDPVNCPTSEFKYQYDIEKYDEIFCDKPFEKTEKKILIVGCGFSGLSTSAALTRYGIPFDVVEANNQIGGNWFSGVYETVHIISSRKTTEMKDYPMPSWYPDFPSAKQMLDYFLDYCKHYRINERLSLNTELTRISEQQNSTGYLVEFKQGNQTFTRVYKGVIINNGHHWSRRMPKYENQEQFTGKIIHSKDYKEPSQLKNQRVLVIGAGNSGCDVAVEAARFGTESHISMRRGYYFLPRTIFGKPAVELIPAFLPLFLQQIMFKFILMIVTGINYQKEYNLPNPDHNLFECHPTINSELLQFVKLGKIHPHGDILRFKGGKKIEFKNGEEIEVDLIVCCTGYDTSIPLLEPFVEKTEYGYPKLYTGIFVPHKKFLYYVGLGQPRYGAGPLLTSSCDMLAKLIKLQDSMKYPVGDVLASVVGEKFPTPQKPKISKDLLIDPHVAWKSSRFFSLFLVHLMPWFEKLSIMRNKLPLKEKNKQE